MHQSTQNVRKYFQIIVSVNSRISKIHRELLQFKNKGQTSQLKKGQRLE